MFGLSTPLTHNEIRQIGATKKFQLGTRGVTSDGRVFRYARAAQALLKAIPVVARVYTHSTGDTYNLATDTTYGSHVPTATFNAIKFCTTGGMNDSFASTVELQDGYLYVAIGVNAGDLIQIKEHTTMGTDCGDMTVYFKDDQRLTETISDTAVIFPVRNIYDDVRPLWTATDHKASTTTSTGIDTGITPGMPIGIPCVDVTANYYFWIQTWGLAVCYSEAAWVPGSVLVPTTTTATYNYNSTYLGGLGHIATGTDFGSKFPQRSPWGYAVALTAGSDYGLCFLTLAP